MIRRYTSSAINRSTFVSSRTAVAPVLCLLLFLSLGSTTVLGAVHGEGAGHGGVFPPPLESYQDGHLDGIGAVLRHRIAAQPFNLVGSLIFLAAIIHTFATARFTALSHRWRAQHQALIQSGEAREGSVSLKGELFHFLGEVEVVFGLWALVLMAAIVAYFDWSTSVHYVGVTVDFTEAAFVVVVMVLASTRPILKPVEALMERVAKIFGGSLQALWMTTLTLGPILGSFITEPAAMTLSALVLSEKVYVLGLSTRLKYATIALLFVNVSVGGTLTHFAAPPVLMVAEPWGWDLAFMLSNFGWKAIVGIVLANTVYMLLFRREFASLQEAFALRQLKGEIERRFVTRNRIDDEFERLLAITASDVGPRANAIAVIDEIRAQMERDTLPALVEKGIDPELIHEAFDKRFEDVKHQKLQRYLPGLLPAEQRPEWTDPAWDEREDSVPLWVTGVHVVLIGWAIATAHYVQLFVFGFFLFLGFTQITAQYQNEIRLRSALLVGFFLAGLVIHGGVQAWWIAPVLGSLAELPLMIMAATLSAFNDNASITYLSTLVPDFSDSLKYAVLSGAVVGGGLTVIANAPNPAGMSLLRHHFGGSVSPAGQLLWVIVPTLLIGACFLFL